MWKWDATEPFGNNAANENPSGLGVMKYNNRLPGQYFDEETGTHYNYYRDYDPSIGRYVQSDPIGLGGGINTFWYGDASPLSLVDPFGLEAMCLNDVKDGKDECPPPMMKEYQKCVNNCIDEQLEKQKKCKRLPKPLQKRCEIGAISGRVICYIRCTAKWPACWRKTFD